MSTSPKSPKKQKKTRYSKGESGNPNGRPTGTNGPNFPTFAQLYEQELRAPWNPREFDGKVIPTKLLLVRNRIKRAMKNDRSQDSIENRMEGMAKQTTEIQGSGSRPLIIEQILTAEDLSRMQNVESQGQPTEDGK
jgi:Family of unknown function (DUF5681)